jgi:heptaprenyl diphosphate synthase
MRADAPAGPSFALTGGDPALDAAVRDGMAQVEVRLREAVAATADPLLAQTARHLVDAGGKRFRPLLVLLASHLGDPTAEGVVPAAVVVELTHIATLYHDDVMDEAPLRRGAQSANARWGNTVAILSGDYLFARASDIVADLGPECVRIQARTFERLVQGQLRETVGPAPGQDPIEHYLSVLADKTGSLIATSARFGALLSGAPADVVDVATRYGERIGVAFQLADDVLDVTGDPADSGKEPGTDLREGVPTLATLLARRDDHGGRDRRLQELLSGPLPDDARHAEALRLLREHPALDAARAEAQRWADAARAELAPLPDVPARRALESLCDAVVERTS